MKGHRSVVGMKGHTSVIGMLEDRIRHHGDRIAIGVRQRDGWREVTYRALSEASLAAASQLEERGVGPGDRVAILSESSPEWAIGFFAAIRAGAVIVPLDIKLTETELEPLLADCAPRALLVSERRGDTAARIAARLPGPCAVLTLDASEGVGSPVERPAMRQSGPVARLPLRERRHQDAALLLYTSGTTGTPKGVVLTFGNLAFEVERLTEAFGLEPGTRFLSVLPLSHLLEITGGFLGILGIGGTILYARSIYPQDLVDSLCERRADGLIGVPLLYKALARGIVQEIDAGPRLRRALFRGALAVAGALPVPAVRRALFRSLHARLGGRLRVLVSGGAPLDPEVERFYETIGTPILSGYGLTETGPVISVNTPASRRIGSVGRPLPGVEVRIFPDGEIATRGPHVMAGYQGRPDLTREVMDPEGWFHTGDLGRLDPEGYLFVTGRSKNLIVLADGTKVQPEEVEAVLSQGEDLEEVCVIGVRSRSGLRAGSEEAWAVAVPSRALRDRHFGRPDLVAGDAAAAIGRLSAALAPHKRPSRVVVRDEPLPRTTTRKVRRAAVASWAEATREEAS